MVEVENYTYFYPEKKSAKRIKQLYRYLKEIVEENNIEHTYTATTKDYVVFYMYSESLPYESLFKNITSLHPDIMVKNIFYQSMGEDAVRDSLQRRKPEHGQV